MASAIVPMDSIEYRVVLIRPGARALLLKAGGGSCLPHLTIPSWTRPAEQLRKTTEVYGFSLADLER